MQSVKTTIPINVLKPEMFVVCPVGITDTKTFGMRIINSKEKLLSSKKFYLPEEIDMLPQKTIFNEPVSCALCHFNSKVRINVYRHLALNGECVKMNAVPGTDPVNPVPCLNSGEKYFDKMINCTRDLIDAKCLYAL